MKRVAIVTAKIAAGLLFLVCVALVVAILSSRQSIHESKLRYEGAGTFYRANFEGRTFPVTVDDRESVATLAEKIAVVQVHLGCSYNFDNVARIEPLNSPADSKLGVRRINGHIFWPGKHISDAELLATFAKLGWRTGTLPELLAFHLTYPEFPKLILPRGLFERYSDTSIVSFWNCKMRAYNFDERSPQWFEETTWRLSAFSGGRLGVYGTYDFGKKGTWDNDFFFFTVEQEHEK